MIRALMFLLLTVFAAQASAQEAAQRIKEALTNLPETSPRPYWMSVINSFGDKERTAIAFGMMDNLAYCQVLVDAYRVQFPSMHAFCEPIDELGVTIVATLRIEMH
jgi:hypothetical protein